MNAYELKEQAHAKMVEAMALLTLAHEKANMKATEQEIKEERAQAVLARFEAMYPVFEGVPSFESDMDTAQEVYDKATQKGDLLRYDVEQIESAMLNLRSALDEIEDTWYYAEELNR